MGNQQPSYFQTRAETVYQQHMAAQVYNKPVSSKRRPPRPPPPNPRFVPRYTKGVLTSDIPTIGEQSYAGGRLSASSPELVQNALVSVHNSNFLLVDSGVVANGHAHGKRRAPAPPVVESFDDLLLRNNNSPEKNGDGLFAESKDDVNSILENDFPEVFSASDEQLSDEQNKDNQDGLNQETIEENLVDSVHSNKSESEENRSNLQLNVDTANEEILEQNNTEEDKSIEEIKDETPAREVFYITVPPLVLPQQPPQAKVATARDFQSLSSSADHVLDSALKDELLRAAAIRATRPPIRDSLLRPTADTAALRAELRHAYNARLKRSQEAGSSSHDAQADEGKERLQELESSIKELLGEADDTVAVNDSTLSIRSNPTDALPESFPEIFSSPLATSSPSPQPSPSFIRSPIRPVDPDKPIALLMAPKGYKRQTDANMNVMAKGWTPMHDLDEHEFGPEQTANLSSRSTDIPNFSLPNQRLLQNLSATSELSTSEKQSRSGSLKNALRFSSGAKATKRPKLQMASSYNKDYPFEAWDPREVLEGNETEVTMLKCYTADGQMVLVPRHAALTVTRQASVHQEGNVLAAPPPPESPQYSTPADVTRQLEEQSLETTDVVESVDPHEEKIDSERYQEREMEAAMARIRHIQEAEREGVAVSVNDKHTDQNQEQSASSYVAAEAENTQL